MDQPFLNPLEDSTTEELVEELTRRHTFLGVVVYHGDFRRPLTAREILFKIAYNSNLSKRQVGTLLTEIAHHLRPQPPA